MITNIEVNQQTEEISRGVHKFDQGSVLSVLLKTALPIVILMFCNSMYAFIDSLMSSAYVEYGVINDAAGNVVHLNGGTTVGLIMPFMSLVIAFEVMIAVGVGLAYTQSMAQNKPEEAQERHNESMTMIIYMGLIILVATIILGIPFILTVSGNWGSHQWSGIDSNTGEFVDYTHKMVLDGYAYMVILALAFIPMQLQQTYVRVLRAEGRGNIAAIIPIAGMPINIFFDWLFMSKFEMGIYGAGLATLIASMAGLLMMVIYVYIQGKNEALNLRLKMPTLRLNKVVFSVIVMFGMTSLLRRVMDSASIMILTGYVGNMRIEDMNQIPNWTGSWTVMTRSINMGTQVSLGVAQAMSMLISYFTNSGQREKASQTLRAGFVSMMVCSLTSAGILFGLQGVLFNAYSHETAFGWVWWNQFSIAFILALIFSIPVSLQPFAVMYYAGTKAPKSTLVHSVIFNGMLVLGATVGLIINIITSQPLYLFGFMVIGAVIGYIIVTYIFAIRYKQIMSN